MRYLRELGIFIVLLIVCGLLLFFVYNEVESTTITQLNTEQMIHAQQAAKGIERFFSSYNNTLSFLAGNDHIIAMDLEGRVLMQEFFLRHAQDITSITRVNKSGIILYTYPYVTSTGANISAQAHVRKSMSGHQVVISDVFTAVQGFRAVAYVMPVFKNGMYDGSLTILIPFEQLTQKDLESVRILNTGYAWAISQKGTILYTPDLALVDRSAFTAYNQSPTAISFISETVKGNPGISSYTLEATPMGKDGPVKYQAVYFPVMIGDTHWSIIVATPEREILSILQGFRNNLLIISGILVISLFFFAYYTSRAWGIVKEEDKRRIAEAALREREEFLNNVVENIPDMIFVKDAKDLRFVKFNKAGEELLGYSREDLAGKNDYDLFPKEQADFFTAKDRAVILKRQLLDTLEERIQTKNQGERILHTKKIPLMDNEGNPQYLLGISEDITERKRAQEELLRKTEELSAAYEELTATADELKHNYDELHRSQQALEQARKKLNLLNIITFQDIQNALFSLEGYLELQKELPMDEKAGAYVDKEKVVAEKISTTLAFAKNYQDMGINPPLWQNINQVFLIAISHLEISGLLRNVNLDHLEMYADPLLENVFFNLVGNVTRHGKTATEISLNYRETTDSLTLYIEDNGAGIPDADKEKIFERGYGAQKGMGLFLVREILGITDISIKETGTYGKGARFEIIVPKGVYRFADVATPR